jgi:Putative beta-barrel porin 2
VLAAASRLARSQNLTPALEGIPAGRFVLYPAVSIDYTRDSNVLYFPSDGSAGELVSSWVTVVRPRIVAHLPLGMSHVTLAYSTLYRNYGTSLVNEQHRFSHYVDLESAYRSPRGLSVTLRDHFVRGTIEVREVDPGGETNFGLVPFVLHEPQLDVTLDLGARAGISVIPRYASNRFDDQGLASFFDYSRRAIEGRFNYKATPLSVVYLYDTLESTDQNRHDAAVADTTFTTRAAGIGVRRELNQRVTAQATIGYQTMRFISTAGDNSTGWVADVRWSWLPNELTRVELVGQRQPYQSFYENNNFYLVNQGGFRLTQQIGHNLYWVLGSTYQANSYPAVSPIAGERRRDRSLQFESGVGYQFQRTLRAFVGYNLERRNSNIDSLDFDVNRLLFRIEAGWM